MRLIDADELKEKVTRLRDLAKKREEDTPVNSPCYRTYVAQANERHGFIGMIDDAPTIEPEITEKQAITKIINSGWLVSHDKELRDRWERPQGECKTCRHRDPEDKKCDCGAKERQGCPFPVSDDYFCKFYEKGGDNA